jgi:hypothetical protein
MEAMKWSEADENIITNLIRGEAIGLEKVNPRKIIRSIRRVKLSYCEAKELEECRLGRGQQGTAD